jgi:hypothetical protein
MRVMSEERSWDIPRSTMRESGEGVNEGEERGEERTGAIVGEEGDGVKSTQKWEPLELSGRGERVQVLKGAPGTSGGEDGDDVSAADEPEQGGGAEDRKGDGGAEEIVVAADEPEQKEGAEEERVERGTRLLAADEPEQ